MVKIIETNLILDDNNLIQDHQSRVIEVVSWGEYINMFENYNGEPVGDYKCIHGNLIGYSLPKMAEIFNLKYDDKKLNCDLLRMGVMFDKKLAYLCT